MKYILITLILTFSFLYSTTIYIPDSYPTIQEGIDNSVSGDSILVRPGTYYGTINYNGKNLYISSLFNEETQDYETENTIIDCSDCIDNIVTFESGEDSTAVFNGFTITNASYRTIFHLEDSCPKIKNSNVTNCDVVSLFWVYGLNESIILDNLTINNNTISELFTGAVEKVVFNECLFSSNIITYCFFLYDLVQEIIFIRSVLINCEIGCFFDFVGSQTTVKLLESTVTNNEITYFYSVWSTNFPQLILTNSIFTNDTDLEIENVELNYSCVNNSIIENTNNLEMHLSIIRNPLIYLEDNHVNYQPDSPCINTGDPNLLDPDGTRKDMGYGYYPIESNEIIVSNQEEFENALENSGSFDTIILEPFEYNLTTHILDKQLIIKSRYSEEQNDDFIVNTILTIQNKDIENSNLKLEGLTLFCPYVDEYTGYQCLRVNESTIELSNNLIIDEIYCEDSSGRCFRFYNSIVSFSNNTLTTQRELLRVEDSNLIMINNINWNSEHYNSGRINLNGDIGNGYFAYNSFMEGEDLINTSSWNPVPYVYDDTNISLDPLFFGDTYYLSSNSPCIDAGDPNFPLDYDGSCSDIGAFSWKYLLSGFSVVNTEIYLGEESYFTSESIGDITNWEWDFNNDGVIDSYDENPTYVYDSPGLKTVSLTVSNENHNDVMIRENYINIIPLFADFTVSSEDVVPELSIQFTDLSRGLITQWEWDFNNDGIVDSYEQNPIYSYDTTGEKTVRLKIINGDYSEEVIKEQLIHVHALIADFTVNTEGIILGESVQFTDLSIGNINRWEWDFDNDGIIDSYEQNPAFTYNTLGDKTVRLEISFSENSDTIIKEQFINVSTELEFYEQFSISPIQNETLMKVQLININDTDTEEIVLYYKRDNWLRIVVLDNSGSVLNEGYLDIVTSIESRTCYEFIQYNENVYFFLILIEDMNYIKIFDRCLNELLYTYEFYEEYVYSVPKDIDVSIDQTRLLFGYYTCTGYDNISLCKEFSFENELVYNSTNDSYGYKLYSERGIAIDLSISSSDTAESRSYKVKDMMDDTTILSFAGSSSYYYDPSTGNEYENDNNFPYAFSILGSPHIRNDEQGLIVFERAKNNEYIRTEIKKIAIGQSPSSWTKPITNASSIEFSSQIKLNNSRSQILFKRSDNDTLKVIDIDTGAYVAEKIMSNVFDAQLTQYDQLLLFKQEGNDIIVYSDDENYHVDSEDYIIAKPEFVLNNNYPNPFNPKTTISFTLPVTSDVKVSIYNIKGQKVKQLVNEKLDKGNHSFEWNGTDSNNKNVSSGVYFYNLVCDGRNIATRKCVLVK